MVKNLPRFRILLSGFHQHSPGFVISTHKRRISNINPHQQRLIPNDRLPIRDSAIRYMQTGNVHISKNFETHLPPFNHHNRPDPFQKVSFRHQCLHESARSKIRSICGANFRIWKRSKNVVPRTGTHALKESSQPRQYGQANDQPYDRIGNRTQGRRPFHLATMSSGLNSMAVAWSHPFEKLRLRILSPDAAIFMPLCKS